MGETDDIQDTSASGPPAWVDCIAEDMPCRLCGYNLRGLEPGGKCPECGEHIILLSISENYLHRSDPRWLRGIGRGALAGILCLLTVPVVMIAGWAAQSGRSHDPLWMSIAIPVLALWSILELTRAEPGSQVSELARRLARHCSVIGFLLTWPALNEFGTEFLVCVGCIGFLLIMSGYTALLFYAEDVGMHKGQAAISRRLHRARQTVWMSILPGIVSSVIIIPREARVTSSLTSTWLPILSIGLLMGLLLVGYIDLLSLLIRIRRKVAFHVRFQNRDH